MFPLRLNYISGNSFFNVFEIYFFVETKGFKFRRSKKHNMMRMSPDLMRGGFFGGSDTDYHVDKSPWIYLIAL